MLVLDISRNASKPSPFNMILAFYVFHIWPWLCKETFLVYPVGLRFFFFNHTGLFYFTKCVLCIYWDNCMVFFFNLLINVISIDLHMLDHSWISEINPTCSQWMTFLMCCWIQLARILLIVFTLVFIKDIFSLLHIFFFVFGINIRWVWVDLLPVSCF